MRKIIDRLKSRKLWAAVAGIVTGLAMVFGLDEGIITSVAGAIVSVASVTTYIITEGKIDAAAVGQAAENVQGAINAIGFEANTEDGK